MKINKSPDYIGTPSFYFELFVVLLIESPILEFFDHFNDLMGIDWIAWRFQQ